MISMSAIIRTFVRLIPHSVKTNPEVIVVFVRVVLEMTEVAKIVSILMNVWQPMAAVLIIVSISLGLMSAHAIKDINYQAMAELVSILTNALNMVQLIYALPRLLVVLILPVLITATVRLGSETTEVVRIVWTSMSVTNTHTFANKSVSIHLVLISAVAIAGIVS